MEAPAPASSLIHSATLVSAGIYIILRFSHIIELSPIITNTIILVGSMTAFYGALIAGYQTDLKKILAYSTISHCGFMMVSAALKHVTLSLYYLFVHGCFKAAAFMCVGNIIHACNNVQDTRKIGNIYKTLPFEFYALLICLLTLSGYPLTYGYYTKHYVITILSSTSY
jgi:NADH-quinone oxidoreductase subunit L